MKSILFILGILGAVFLSTAAFGEFYKFTDENGAVHYTDDLSLVPENQRPNVASFESNEAQAVVAENKEIKQEILSKSGNDSERKKQKAELDRIKEKLIETYKELNDKRKTIGNPPPEDAKSGKKEEHIRMSKELNKQIEEYNKLSDEFDKKVNEYNEKYS